jgi:hypothetical protein
MTRSRLPAAAVPFLLLGIVFLLTGQTGVGIAFLALGVVFTGSGRRHDGG